MTEKTPGYKYYEIERAPVVQLPKGYGVTKVTAKKIGFYADYFDENGDPAALRDVEIVDTADGVDIRDLTRIAKHEAAVAAKSAGLEQW